jgi:hypothetical protein
LQREGERDFEINVHSCREGELGDERGVIIKYGES